jgi:hypothetical protein
MGDHDFYSDLCGALPHRFPRKHSAWVVLAYCATVKLGKFTGASAVNFRTLRGMARLADEHREPNPGAEPKCDGGLVGC